MSDSAGEARSTREAFGDLEDVIDHLLASLETVTRRAEEAERRSAEFGDTLGRLAGDPSRGRDLLERLERLEAENRDLKGRLEEGRDGVDRLLARVRFMEERA